MSSLHSSSGHQPSSTRQNPSQRPRTRRRRALALVFIPLFVAPTLAAAAAAAAAPAAAADMKPLGDVVAPTAAVVDPAATAAAAVVPTAAAAAAAAPASGSKAKYDMTVKDVPFDGKDGKPHEGPFVEVDNSRSKPSAADVDETPPKTPVYIDGKKVPESNDGVMDDKNRVAPKKGTTGMAGGVSEKDKQRKAKEGQTGERVENTPETPKEVPDLPHHEEKKIHGQAPGKDAKDEKDKKETKETTTSEGDVSGIGKPADLPDRTDDKAIPVPGSAQKDHLDVSKTPADKAKLPPRPAGGDDDESSALIRPLHSFLLSLTMILFSEVGDKTFLVAALMAMKHDRVVVFTAAFSALFTMTLLSTVLGHAVPVLIPKWLTNFLAAGLFLVFGAKLLREGMAMGAHEGVGAEMQELEMELAEKEQLARENGRRRSRATGDVISPDVLEMGIAGGPGARMARSQSRFSTPNRSASSSLSPPPSRVSWGGGAGNGNLASKLKGFGSGLSNLASLLLSPAWVQTFVMTFLGEWGDRSQIATLAMAAGQDYWWVTLGAITGHACCTSVAVLGGRAIAGRVSMKVVTIGGAVSFLLFGVIYLLEAFYAA